MSHPLARDLDHVLTQTAGLWNELRGQRIFITGGTGFFGCWLLETFVHATDALDLGATAVVLTRDAEAFRRKAPHLVSHPAVQLHVGDVRSFDFPEGSFSHIVHAGSTSSAPQPPRLLVETIVQGTLRALDFAVHCGARKFLFCSSGAVYGKQPPDITHMSEGFLGAPDPLDSHSVYGEGKRMAELLCSLYAREFGIQAKIARGFAFVGPHLPLDAHFAIGNFIRDGLAGGPIRVSGDGTPLRSYLYAADLAVWLWRILFSGAPCRAYNVGSDVDMTIATLAATVAHVFGRGIKVSIARQADREQPAQRYVPCTARALDELGLRVRIDIEESIRRTIAWHRGNAATSIEK